MIEGFEEFTPDLTEDETALALVIAKALNKRVGKSKKITNREMRKAIFEKTGIKLAGATMRKYIQYIRVHGLCNMLVASGGGYWIAENEEEFISRMKAFASRNRSQLFTEKVMWYWYNLNKNKP